MSHIVEMSCPGCGARVQINQKDCEYCHAPVVISSMSEIFSMPATNIQKYSKSYESNLKDEPTNAEINNSLGMCYLKMGFYEKALEKFSVAIEQDFNNSETYLFAAICVLAGRKPFITPRCDIDKIERYIDAALMIEERGIFRFFQAYIKHDYFKRKFFNTSPSWDVCLKQGSYLGFSELDIKQLFQILRQEIPKELYTTICLS